MRHYEIVVLVHPDQSEQVSALIDKHAEVISKHNGTIHRKEDWGRRQLAYPIDDMRKAHYVLLNVESPLEAIDEIKESFNFNDSILRYLITKEDKAITAESPVLVAMKDKADKSANKHNFNAIVDYKDVNVLKKHITETGKIIPSRVTGTKSKKQRKISSAVKVARFLALLPYCDNHK